MDSLQVLHNKAAKIVLNRCVYSSSTQAFLELRWINLRARRDIHRCVNIFKRTLMAFRITIINFSTGSSVHYYQTRHASDLKNDRPRCSKGQLYLHIFYPKNGTIFPLKSETVKVLAVSRNTFTSFSIILIEKTRLCTFYCLFYVLSVFIVQYSFNLVTGLV